MVKVVVLVRRQEGLSREQFLEYWCDEHPWVVWALPGLRRYMQNVAIDHRKRWPADGVAELWFDSVGAVARAFDTEAATEMFAHGKPFIGSSKWLITEERDVPDPRHAAQESATS